MSLRAQLHQQAHLVALALSMSACAWPGTVSDERKHPSSPAPAWPDTLRPHAGVLRVLTYNVAGLPELLSASNPATNNLLASALFNDYDLVLAQEDFAYHDDLVELARHPYRLTPLTPVGTLFGDGLCALSMFPFERAHRVRWKSCNGYLFDASDCFGEKGFSMARVRLTPKINVHVYNLHAEAGDSQQDVAARRQGFRQLTGFLKQHSSSSAVIVAGDTNLDARHATDRTTLAAFMLDNSLIDACDTTRCARPGLDRVLYRASPSLDLEATRYYEDPRFVDEDGRGLSDHQAIAVELAWQAPQL